MKKPAYTLLFVMLACVGIVVSNNYRLSADAEHAVIKAEIKKLNNTPRRLVSVEEVKDEETGITMYKGCDNFGWCVVGPSKEDIQPKTTKSSGGFPVVDLAAIQEMANNAKEEQ